MNELLDDETRDDDPIIARLRGALDELTASAGDGEVSTPSQRTMTSARWMAVAAAAVLVVGAVTAVVVNRGSQGESASPPTSAAPITLPATTEPSLIRVETPFFTIASPDLVPGERTFEQCCRTDALLSMAWSSGDDFLMLTEYPSSPVIELFPELASTLIERENASLLFRSVGLTQIERDLLAEQVVAGSGLPYVLPVDGWTIAAMGYTQGAGRLLQVYTPLNTDPLSSYLPTITLSVGEYRGELDELARWPDPQQVQVAGYDGWKVTEADGTVTVFWEVDNGNWATVRIDVPLADRADGLIAAIAEIDPTEPTEATTSSVEPTATDPSLGVTVVGDVLPPFEASAASDPAVGMPAPTVSGFDYEGNEIRIDPAEGPHLVVFVAHWCPHCADTIPNVMEWMADGTIPAWLPVTLVSTAESPSGANNPPERWLQEHGWTGRVLRDSNDADGAAGQVGVAYGATGWPYFVVIGTDGNVLARAADGELNRADIEPLIERVLSRSADVIGRLEIPAINVDVQWVKSSLDAETAEGLGRVSVVGSLPIGLNIGEDQDYAVFTIIHGNRTTPGAPFAALDQLVVGDTFTWAGELRTATFEVVYTDTCPVDEGCPGVAAGLLLTASDPGDESAVHVYARRIA